MTALHLDCETYSAADLKTIGAHAYFDHPSTGVWCVAYAFDEEDVGMWTSADAVPQRVTDHIRAGGAVWAHNAIFERRASRAMGVPQLLIEQMHCTMAMSYAMGLPGGLDRAAAAVGLQVRKDHEGYRIMMQLAQPHPDGGWYDPERYPKEHARLREYCMQDVRVERELGKRILALSAHERKIWILDQRINDRGIGTDRVSAAAAMKIVRSEEERLNTECSMMTGLSVTQNVKLVQWLQERRCPIDSLAKDVVADTLEMGPWPIDVERVLRIRQEAAKSSTKKLLALLKGVCTDGRLRGMCQYHGAFTGRWAGRRFQPHNLQRPESDYDTVEFVLKHLGAPEALRLLGKPMALIADSMRSFLVAAPGHEFLSADLSQIEARMLAWLAGDQKTLNVFRTHGKLYEHAAAGIYHVPLEAITKSDPRRQIGKVACIAEGQLVLTDAGLIPIEKISALHRVWDGVEWVSHDGAVYQGEWECLTYDGLTATADHQVWTRDGRKIPFGDCAGEQDALLSAGAGRRAIRIGRGDGRGRELDRRLPSRMGSVCGVRRGEVDKPGQPPEAKNTRMSKLFSDHSPTIPLVTPQIGGGAAAMPEQRRQEVSAIRRARREVQMGLSARGCAVGSGEYGASRGTRSPHRDRQEKQQRALRTGQSPIRVSGGELQQQREHVQSAHSGEATAAAEGVLRVSGSASRSALRRSHAEAAAPGDVGRTDSSALGGAVVQTKRRVWDILNAGPRRRFTVSGKLVSNCLALGYGGGKNSFVSMGKNYGIKVPPTEAEQIKVAWRAAHPEIVAYWARLEQCALAAVMTPGASCSAGRVTFKKSGSFLLCRLPSGRVIVYPYPKISQKETPWGEMKDTLTYQTVHEEDNQWMRTHTYGGKLAENVTQAAARDVLSDGMVRIEDAGHPIVLTVHDEAVVETPIGSVKLEEINRLMSVTPSWAPGLPVASEGWCGRRYRKG